MGKIKCGCRVVEDDNEVGYFLELCDKHYSELEAELLMDAWGEDIVHHN